MATPKTSTNNAAHAFSNVKVLSTCIDDTNFVPAQKAWRNFNKAKTTAITVTSSPSSASFVTSGHSFALGDIISVVGASPSSLNTNYTVATVTSTTAFTATPTGTAFSASASTQGEVIFKTPQSRWVQVYPTTIYVDSFTYTLGTPSYNTINFSFNVPNATSWTLYDVDAAKIISSGTTTSGTFTYTAPTPAASSDFTLSVFGNVYNTTTSTVETGSVAQTITVNLDQLPAPTFAPVIADKSDVGATITWTGTYAGATSYNIVDFNSGNVYASGVASGATITGLTINSTYTIVLQANVGGVASPNGLPTTFTTDTFVNGIFPVSPKQVYTQFQSYYNSTSWTSTGNYYHGDGTSYGAQPGVYYSYFYYGANALSGIPTEGTWSQAEVYFKRSTTIGPSFGFINITLHKYTTHSSSNTISTSASYTAATPADKSGWWQYLTNAFSKNEAIWVTLPTEWIALLKAGTYKGITIGGIDPGNLSSASYYMMFDRDLGGSSTVNGQLRFTVI